MKNLKRNVEGITLIALVITIIVLLILAGVTIAMLIGENGILKRTIDAKEQTKKASEEEQRQLTIAEATMNLNGTKYKSTYKGKEVTVPIPAGFAVSQVDGENTIEDGLVIIDEERNEFVWIPVNKENFNTDFIRYEGYANGKLQDFLNKTEEVDRNGNSSAVPESESTKKEAIEMYKSVEENGGFYIGRYETGKDNSGNAVVQKNANVYNNVNWGNSNSDDTGGAVEKSRAFCNENNYNNSVVSTLIYGVEWDATMGFIDNDYKSGHCNENSYVVNCKEKGWYSNNSESNIHKTGEGNFKIKNIYDLGGNVYERTMEISKETYYRVLRRWLLWKFW